MSKLALFENNLPAYLKNVELDDVTKALSGGGNKIKRIALGNNKFILKVGGVEISKSANEKMNVVVVNAAKDVSRTFYAAAYDPSAEATPPDCWSPDGRTPDASIEKPQCATCDNCPQNIEGSGQGKSKACRFNRRIAVVLASDIGGDVYQMELKSKSFFYSKKEPGDLDHMPFDQYANYVGSQGYNLNNLVTEMRFDDDSTVGKLFFRPIEFLSEEQWEIAKKQKETPAAKSAITMTVAQIDGVKKLAAPELPKLESVAKPAPKAVKVEVEVEEVPEPKKRKEDKPVVAPKKDLKSIMGDWTNEE